VVTHVFKKQIQKLEGSCLSRMSTMPNFCDQSHLREIFFKIHLLRRRRPTSTYENDSWTFNASNCPKSSINTLNQPTCYVLDHFHQSFPYRVFTLSFNNKYLWVCIYSLLSQSFLHFEQELSPQLTRVTRIYMPIFPQK
jgi:hypothetical protein